MFYLIINDTAINIHLSTVYIWLWWGCQFSRL